MAKTKKETAGTRGNLVAVGNNSSVDFENCSLEPGKGMGALYVGSSSKVSAVRTTFKNVADNGVKKWEKIHDLL